MTEREIDALLATWKSRLAAAAQNLVELRAHPCYQRVAGNHHEPKAQLTGVTAQRISPALEAMGTLFEQFYLIQQCIDRAEALRRDMPVFGAAERLREIEELLRGKSIHLQSVQVPIEQRSLLSAVENVEVISPGDLLNAMTRAFEAARDGVLALNTAWNKLDVALDEAKAEIALLREWDAKAAAGLAVQLASAEATVDSLRANVATDPLGVDEKLSSQVLPILKRVRSTLENLATLRRDIEAGLQSARARLYAMAALHAKAGAVYAENRDKVTECAAPQPPQPDVTLEQVRAWLQRLEQRYSEGILAPLAVALKNWNNTADAYVQSEQEAYEGNREPLETRAELRGRLDALKAKARAYGLAEDPALTEAARQAADLLYSRPTPLRRAHDLVVRYEARLNGRTVQA